MPKIDVADYREKFHAVPQKMILELLGFKQWTQLSRFADRWRLPICGATTDLFVLFKALRNFVEKYGTILAALLDDLPPDGSENTLGARYLKAKIAKTEADARMAELRAAEREGRLRDVGLVNKCLELLCSRARATGEVARRKWGNDGEEIFKQMVDGFNTDMRSFIDTERAAKSSPVKPTRKATAKRLKPET